MKCDLAIIGAGAAGLMAAIWAGRSAPQKRILLLDSAPKPGAKILISGGGRCNVTHTHVTPQDYAGSTPNAIRKVLRRFDVPQTRAFFESLGVRLKEEAGGKLFPVSDRARDVLAALLDAVHASGGELLPKHRVTQVERLPAGFRVRGPWGALEASKVILATGGQSLPQTGSDGSGYALAQSLGHTLTPHLLPALVPLTLPTGHFLTTLRGLSAEVCLEVRTASGKRLHHTSGALLCTHFGISGPAVLDISRHYLLAHLHDPHASLFVNFLPGSPPETLDAALQTLGKRTPLRLLTPPLPERLGRALCAQAGLPAGITGSTLTRQQRRALVQTVTALRLPITGSRGFQAAEVTAGGVPLNEVFLARMESRCTPGLYLCGEICDVDGRIGGFNFQWAWASGYVAGSSVFASKT